MEPSDFKPPGLKLYKPSYQDIEELCHAAHGSPIQDLLGNMACFFKTAHLVDGKLATSVLPPKA